VTHPCYAGFCQCHERRRALLNHDIDRHGGGGGQPFDQPDVDEPRCEEPVRPGILIAVRALQRVGDHPLVVLCGWSLEKYVGAGIDEERQTSISGYAPRAADAERLFLCASQPPVGGDAVLEVATHGSCIDCECHAGGNGLRAFPVTAFEIHRYRQLGHARDATQILDRETQRQLLTVGETIGVRHRPAARGDGLGTARNDCFRAARIPYIEKNKWVPGTV